MNYLYLEDFNETLNELIKEDDIKAAAPKLVYYGIKYINNSNNEVATKEEAIERMNFIKLVLMFTQQLTPADLLDLFPIEERYKIFGSTTIDPHTSLEYIQQYGLDNLIQEPMDFLWYYNNKDTGSFVMNTDQTIRHYLRDEYVALEYESNKYRVDFINGVRVGPCRVHRDLEGRAYLINEEGKSIELKRQFPGYLKPIK